MEYFDDLQPTQFGQAISQDSRVSEQQSNDRSFCDFENHDRNRNRIAELRNVSVYTENTIGSDWKSDRIGSGSYGIVYKVKLLEEDKLIAVKESRLLNREELSKKNQEIWNDVLKMRSIDHKNFIKLIGIVVRENLTTLILMEYCDGGSLGNFLLNFADEMNSQKLPLDVQVSWLKQISEAMKYLDTIGSKHGDLKANNIVFSNRVSLYRKGLLNAKLKIIDICVKTNGTATHMSPEAIKDKKSVTIKSDVWSFGVLIYEIATLRRPFEELDFYAVIYNVGKGRILEFLKFPAKEVNFDLINLAKQCFEFYPDRRISFEEISNVLDNI